MSLVITKENFESEVLKSDKPVLVDFWWTFGQHGADLAKCFHL